VDACAQTHFAVLDNGRYRHIYRVSVRAFEFIKDPCKKMLSHPEPI